MLVHFCMLRLVHNTNFRFNDLSTIVVVTSYQSDPTNSLSCLVIYNLDWTGTSFLVPCSYSGLNKGTKLLNCYCYCAKILIYCIPPHSVTYVSLFETNKPGRKLSNNSRNVKLVSDWSREKCFKKIHKSLPNNGIDKICQRVILSIF